ncbi:MAG: ABC transporter permease [Deltaproteobacteria bacterium]|nr:ABC transporter permease [Deltaproteobacteria bacterium]
MGFYILRRLFLAIPTILGVSIIIFLMLRIAPGDPAEMLLGEKASKEVLMELREGLNLNKPLYVQYWLFLKDLAKFDLGTTIWTKQNVWVEVKERFPATIELTFCALMLSTIMGVILGLVSAAKQYSIVDYLGMIVSLSGISLPIFWLGLMLMLIFSLWFNWFPVSGRIGHSVNLEIITNFYIIDSILTKNWVALKDAIAHLVLPSITLASVGIAMTARMTRSSMLEVLKQDYIKTAKAKGLGSFSVFFKHGLRNALIPVITILGLQAGYLMGGAVLTETVFSWPGVGKWIFEGVTKRDYIVIQGGTLVIAVSFVLINMIVDILYSFINPKISVK